MAKKHKDWFDRDCAIRLANAIKPNYMKFDIDAYVKIVEVGVPNLELKDRVKLMANAMRAQLPDAFPQAAKILEASLGLPLDGETGMFTQGYWLMPVARLVEEHGLECFDVSMELCAQITRRHTAEYAVRPFIELDQARALEIHNKWARSDDLHLRRLASEGVRPRLPWARKLQQFIDDPEPILALVSFLKSDPSHYVRMSVANLINDVSKDHPDRIVGLAKEWSKSNNPHTRWILKHGSRTLGKRGIVVLEN